MRLFFCVNLTLNRRASYYTYMENSERTDMKTTEPIELSFHERNAAIRAYNSTARASLGRAAMVDTIIAAINDERQDPQPDTPGPTRTNDAPGRCKEPGCNLRTRSRGFCNRHYQQLKRREMEQP